MPILYDEISDSGILEDDFNDLFSASGGFQRSVTAYRANPSFSLHDQVEGRDGTQPFSADADDTKIVRAYTDSGTVYVEYLTIESDTPGSPNSWSSPTPLSTTLDELGPRVFKQEDGWDVFLVDASGVIKRYHSSDGTGSWSGSTFGVSSLPTDGTTLQIAYGYVPGSTETIYALTYDATTHTYKITGYFTVASVDLGIFLPDRPTSMDCRVFYDNSDDKNGLFDYSDVRHCLVLSTPLPTYFTYIDTETVPQKVAQPSGGVVAYIVRPYLIDERPYQVSRYYDVQAFDKVTSLQYRGISHVSSMSSLHGDSRFDTLWCAATGGDGDINGADKSFGYTSLYYYNSRDGINWSQSKMIPVDDIADWENFSESGIQIVRCGNYVYLLSANTTLRSLCSYEFGVTHPDWQADISPYITDYQSSVSETRQTSITLVNRDNALSNTILGSPGVIYLVTKIGTTLDDTQYLFQVSIEEIDSVQFNRQANSQSVQIVSRDLMSRLTDKTQSEDSIQYDSQVGGLDIFQFLGGTPNGGLAHTATQSGTWTGAHGTLRAVSSYTKSIEFNTFKSSIEDGFAEWEGAMPNPYLHNGLLTPDAGNNPTYFGVIFRAEDKDNFWTFMYDFWAEVFVIYLYKNGNPISYHSYAASDFWVGEISSERTVKMRVEFRGCELKMWTRESDDLMHWLGTYILPGRSGQYTPLSQGYVGILACGFSDEDGSAAEPDPIEIVVDGPTDTDVPAKMLILMETTLLRITHGELTLGGFSPTWDTLTLPVDPGPGLATYMVADAWKNEDYYVMMHHQIVKIANVWTDATMSVVASADVSETIWYGTIASSINRPGYFTWMGDTIGDTNYRQFYTEDYFETIKSHILPVVIGPGSGAIVRGGEPVIVLGCFNGRSNGWIGVVASYMYGGASYSKFCYSSNWGKTWHYDQLDSDVAIAVYTLYDMPDGSPADNGQFLTVTTPDHFGSLGTTADSPMSLNAVNFTASFSDIGDMNRNDFEGVGPATKTIFNGLTVNASYLALATGSTVIKTTDDFGATWTDTTMPASIIGLNGFPTNPNWMIAWGGGLYITLDRWATYTDIGAVVGADITAPIRTAVADLSDWYNIPFR